LTLFLRTRILPSTAMDYFATPWSSAIIIILDKSDLVLETVCSLISRRLQYWKGCINFDQKFQLWKKWVSIFNQGTWQLLWRTYLFLSCYFDDSLQVGVSKHRIGQRLHPNHLRIGKRIVTVTIL
jgi:hypothetical protein